MSDSVKKYHEMLEEGKIKVTGVTPYIYESPDGGATITRRPFMGDISEREVIQKPEISKQVKRDAYTILSVYTEDSIRLAAKILDVGE